MTLLIPSQITVRDICTQALKDCGAFGVGQTPLAEDITDAWFRLQSMLELWNRKRWLVYHLKTIMCTSTGAITYSVGPGQQFDTGVGSTRPDKIESAFLRQLTQSQPNQIDYPLELLQSMEDYNQIALKQLVSFPGKVFYDPTWPSGTLYVWPVMQPDIYATGITVKESLPAAFANLNSLIGLPYEYIGTIVSNLAVELKPKYGMPISPGDPLVFLAKTRLNTLRGANTAIARLQVPADLNRPGVYNIFSDRYY